jgi:hypothetical protein
MLTGLHLSAEALTPYEKWFVANVREHGWFATSVFGDAEGPGFSYTTGFWLKFGQAEIILFGLKGDIAHGVFWDVFRDLEKGRTLPVCTATEGVFGNAPAYVFPVAEQNFGDYVGSSRWFYRGDHYPCLQIVWPDRTGLFPWEGGFDPEFRNDQPDLTETGWRAALDEAQLT